MAQPVDNRSEWDLVAADGLWYLPILIELADYADEHLGGWIFAPTRGQRDWAKSWADAVGRGIALMNEVAGEDGSAWTWMQRYLRHHFASWSLAPEEDDGPGPTPAQVVGPARAIGGARSTFSPSSQPRPGSVPTRAAGAVSP